MDQYFLQGLAPATQRTYDSAKRRYLALCQLLKSPAVPASEHQLCLFAAFLAQDGLLHRTIKCYLSAVRHLHISRGSPDPGISNMPRLEQVLKGIKAVQAKQERKGRTRLPMTPEIMMKLKAVWNPGQMFNATMLWAAASLCFFGFLRSGEITVPSKDSFDRGAHLTADDITVDTYENPTMLKVRIKASKTDPFRKGVDIYVGTTGSSLCPVTAVLTYMAMRPQSQGPLFHFEDSTPLTQTGFVEQVRKALSAAGVDASKYAGHSFRSGAATAAASMGLGEATIKMLGRWQSSAYQLYIKTPRQQLAEVSRVLVGNLSTT